MTSQLSTDHQHHSCTTSLSPTPHSLMTLTCIYIHTKLAGWNLLLFVTLFVGLIQTLPLVLLLDSTFYPPNMLYWRWDFHPTIRTVCINVGIQPWHQTLCVEPMPTWQLHKGFFAPQLLQAHRTLLLLLRRPRLPPN